MQEKCSHTQNTLKNKKTQKTRKSNQKLYVEKFIFLAWCGNYTGNSITQKVEGHKFKVSLG